MALRLESIRVDVTEKSVVTINATHTDHSDSGLILYVKSI